MAKHCPFCGGTRVSIEEGLTFRWRHAKCDECGARACGVRIQTTGEFLHNCDAEYAAEVAAMKQWNERSEEGLQYVAEWIHYHRTVENRHPAYLSALGDIQTHVDAAIERLRHGDPMRMSSQLDTTEELDNERERR